MTIITKNRTIRPSSRLEKSKSYKIDTKNVYKGDVLVVNIDHETKSFSKTYKFNGLDVAHKDSISFRVNDFGTSIEISWSDATPIGVIASATLKEVSRSTRIVTSTLDDLTLKTNRANLKSSFDPISNSETTILILGTLPGDKSIELGEYYACKYNTEWVLEADNRIYTQGGVK